MRLIDTDAFEIIKVHTKVGGKTVLAEVIQKVLDTAPTVDAIPISFIEEQAKLCNEIGFRRGEECYMALIEDWRERNETS